MKFNAIVMVAILVFQVCAVAPLLWILTERTIKLGKRTAILCEDAIGAHVRMFAVPDGCKP